jgi:RHS repeat-associated protein
VNYTYDELGRLKTPVTDGSAANPQWGLQWTYDRYGNRTNQQVTAGSGYNVPLTLDPSTNHINGISFDPSGNVTQDNSYAYKYDGENRLVDFGNGGATYAFYGNGLRAKRTYGSTTVYIFSGSQVIAEYTSGAAATSPTREYIYSGGLLASIEGGTTKYYFPDHLSTRVTMANGTTTEQGHYPFGENWYGSMTEKEKFTTYERDTESGNDYATFRSYVSRHGRFLTPDPLGTEAVDVTNPQSWNRYAYVVNIPTNVTDPLGLFMCLVCTYDDVGADSRFFDEWSLCTYLEMCGNDPGPLSPGDPGVRTPATPPPAPPVLKRNNTTTDCSKPPDLSALPPTGPSGMDPATVAASMGPALRLTNSVSHVGMLGIVFYGFRPGGPMDIKQDVNSRGPLGNVFADFGNFNYGAVCSTVMSLTACQGYAGMGQLGYAALKAAPSQGSGIPFFGGCNGDQCWDAQEIARGYAWVTGAKQQYDTWAEQCRSTQVQ